MGNATITDGSTSHTLTELSGDSSYNVTVTAFTMAGVVVSEELVIQTPEAGLCTRKGCIKLVVCSKSLYHT